MPKISVIVPCYNQAQYLDECLQSVLDQTYTDWECIIVNDGSPDNTEDVAKKWTEKDARFKYLKKENGGLSSARNAGIENAKGEWILPLDADDKIGERYLELAEKEFEKEYTIIYCEAEFFGDKTGKWELPEFSIPVLAEKNCIFCSAFYNKSNWERVGGYDIKMQYGLEDWEFWINILNNDKFNVFKLNYVGFYYRMKENSMITNLVNDRKKQMICYIEQKHFQFFTKHLGLIHELYSAQQKEREKYHSVINSKRYKIGNRIAFFIEKLKII